MDSVSAEACALLGDEPCHSQRHEAHIVGDPGDVSSQSSFGTFMCTLLSGLECVLSFNVRLVICISCLSIKKLSKWVNPVR